MNEKERLLKWLDLQVESAKAHTVLTDAGVEISNMNGDVEHDKIFMYNVAEMARIIGAELQIEPRNGKDYNARVFFVYKGVKIYDLFNV